MPPPSVRALALGTAILAIFGVSAIVLLNLIPGPYTTTDYIIVGSLSTLVCLLVVFFILLGTSLKGPNTFFKRRQR